VRKVLLLKQQHLTKLSRKYIRMDQCRLDLMFMRTSLIIRAVSTTMYTENLKEVTLSKLLDGVLKMIHHTGYVQTHGIILGVKTASSELNKEIVELMIQFGHVSQSIIHTLYSFNDIILLRFKH